MKAYKLYPTLKDFLWGGQKLKNLYNKKSDMDKIAESWELSCFPGSETTVDEDGQRVSLPELLERHPDYVNRSSYDNDEFPVLVKLIDASESLSVQVHPPDAYAREHEHKNGKDEFWYILNSSDDAYIYLGLNKDMTEDEFMTAIENNSIENFLNKVPVKSGDFFFIPAGTIHAIGKGCLLLEIQESSDVTYRIYDYDRKDENGNPRELHLNKALDVANLHKMKIIESNDERFFNLQKVQMPSTSKKFYLDKNCFHQILNLENSVRVKTDENSVELLKGESAFIPAGLEEIELINPSNLLVLSFPTNNKL